MKKYFASGLLIIVSLFSMCGCSSGKNSVVSKYSEIEENVSTDPENVTEEEPSISIESPPPVEERIVETAEGTYIYDNAGMLSETDFSECNDYAEWLYENYLINTAVVTTNSLDGLSPYDYAAKAYVEIYEGRGSGLLLLINNDTNQDYLYKTGSCQQFVLSGDEEQAFYWATKEIVGGDVRTAVMRLMQLGEKCPRHVFDNAGVFSVEQLEMIEHLLSDSAKEVSLLATTNATAVSNEDVLQSYFQRKYGDSEGFMIMLDTNLKTVLTFTNGQQPQGLDQAIEKAKISAAKGDYYNAVNGVIEEIIGKTANDVATTEQR